MTAADFERFGLAVRRLARSFNKPVESALVEDWFADLKGFSIGLVERAFDVVRQSSHFWPKPAALLGACRDLAQRDALTGGVNVPEYVDHQAGVYFCSVCQDAGFERGLVCDGSGVCHLKGCGALGSAVESHPFTRRCACRASNPVLQRERDASRRPAPGANG